MKHTFLTFIALIASLLFTFPSTLVQAEEMSYDELLNELSSQERRLSNPYRDPYADIKIHAGVGLVGSVLGLKVKGRELYRSQDGMQISLGIDLFSQHWMAETGFRNYGETETGAESFSMREFDLRVIHRNRLVTGLGYRLGAGLAARYLTYHDDKRGIKEEDSTPSTLMLFGLEKYLSPTLSVGGDMALRNSLIGDTSDRNSVDLSLRLDTHF